MFLEDLEISKVIHDSKFMTRSASWVLNYKKGVVLILVFNLVVDLAIIEISYIKTSKKFPF